MVLTITNKHNKKTIIKAFVNEEEKDIILWDLDTPDTYSLTNAVNHNFLHMVYNHLWATKQVKSGYMEYRFLLRGTDGIVSEWNNGTFKFVRYADERTII